MPGPLVKISRESGFIREELCRTAFNQLKSQKETKMRMYKGSRKKSQGDIVCTELSLARRFSSRKAGK